MNRTDVLSALEAHLVHSLEHARNRVASLQESLGAESKSSAGDKHETGRAMIQHELEQAVGAQNRSAQALAGFRKIAANHPSDTVATGSLVRTPRGWFFTGMGLGKISVGGSDVFCISLASPIGQALKGAKAGSNVAFQNGSLEVLEVG